MIMANTATASSVLVYPPGYIGERLGVEGQIDILRTHFSGIDPDPAIRYWREVRQKVSLPEWADQPFVIIRSGFLSSKPAEEASIILREIPDLRNEFKERLNERHFMRDSSSVKEERSIANFQPGDLWIIDGQFGRGYCGFSARRTRESLTSHEFLLGSAATGCMFLTHPKRLEECSDKYIDWIRMGGDRWRGEPEGEFDHVPRLKRGSQGLVYDMMYQLRADDRCGTTTGAIVS
jgi:hypothetical protein